MIDSKTSAAGRSASLADLLDAIEMVPQADCDITGVTSDSREVSPGMLFVAVPGVAVDGHKYIRRPLAAECRCRSVPVCRRRPRRHSGLRSSRQPRGSRPTGVAVSTATPLRRAQSRRRHRHQRKDHKQRSSKMARLRGHKAGLISTVANIVDTDSEPAEHTTPDPWLNPPSSPPHAGCSQCSWR